MWLVNLSIGRRESRETINLASKLTFQSENSSKKSAKKP